jgi:hypothetical protein
MKITSYRKQRMNGNVDMDTSFINLYAFLIKKYLEADPQARELLIKEIEWVRQTLKRQISKPGYL